MAPPMLLPKIRKFMLVCAVATTLAHADTSCDADPAMAATCDSMLQVEGGLKQVKSNALAENAASEQVDDEAEEEDDAESESAHDAELADSRRRDSRRRRRAKLYNSDFATGTLRITQSGRYELKEDIVFAPQSFGQSWSSIPPDSTEYPQLGGYFLGFFAALTIEADDVELDCKGHEIKMSTDFHKRQRFFSIIELGSSPFPLGQGPPQFASNYTTPATPTFAKNVVIEDCRLGLSSHHSIHGNANDGVTIKNTQMYDFEVAGIALNGAFNVYLRSLNVGPSLKHTFGAGLSQAIFLDHLASTLMEDDAVVAPLKRSKTVKLRGQTYTAQAIFDELRTSLQLYVDKHTGPMVEVAGTGHDLPDGSAIYGVLLHRAGVAIGRVGVCPDDSKDNVTSCKNIWLEDIHIFDLALKVDQVVNYHVNDKIVAGPAGDVFQVTRAWDAKNCHQYKGNVLMDAEIAIGALCEDLQGVLPTEEFKSFCGGCFMPSSVVKWASGDQTCQETDSWATSLTQGTAAGEHLTCLGDSMNHHNKGAIPLRLGFQEDITVQNVLVEDIHNTGVANAAPYCTVQNYEGVDVRAASIAHMKDLHEFSIKQKGALNGTDPKRIFPITGFLQMRSDDGPTQA